MNGRPSSTGPKCLLIADDLTGACDAAVHFAMSGARTVVSLDPRQRVDGADVLAFSTESRDVAPADARRHVAEAGRRLGELRPEVIFKKIDSTLRGNTGTEIVAALDAFGCDAVVVNPAFPAQKRVVEAGILRVTSDPSFQPVEIGTWLNDHGAVECRHVLAGEIADAISGGSRFVILDAVCDADLERIAAEILQIGKRVLWAGSGGLAAALARTICPNARPSSPPPKQTGAVLFCLGSDHRVTLEQQSRLLQARTVRLLHAATAAAPEMRSEIERGNHVVLRIPRGEIPAERVGRLLTGIRPAAILLSGGDTASLVCRALGAAAIEMNRELAPGIPLGTLRGGTAEGCTVITKSGGFGTPDDLIRIGDYFHG